MVWGFLPGEVVYPCGVRDEKLDRAGDQPLGHPVVVFLGGVDSPLEISVSHCQLCPDLSLYVRLLWKEMHMGVWFARDTDKEGLTRIFKNIT
jgi:hypothetical protein